MGAGTNTDEAIVDLLHALGDLSAQAILPHFRVGVAIESKHEVDFDPVTEADKAAERAIRDAIQAAFPGHGIIGEEFAAVNPDAATQWVIDPIDGTRAFIQGLPTWGTLVGVVEDGCPKAGLMNQPFTRERIWSDGRASYFRGPDGGKTTLATRRAPQGGMQMVTTDPGLFASRPERAGFDAVRSLARGCRYGTDCYGYMLLAAGHIDVVLETGLKPYDIMALIPIIEHAGGRVTDWDGGPATAGGRVLACGDPELHADLVSLLRNKSR